MKTHPWRCLSLTRSRGLLLAFSALLILSMLLLGGGAELVLSAREVLQTQFTRSVEPLPPDVEPLTDVAPPPREVDVRAEEHPALRLRHFAPSAAEVLPAGMGAALPPGWTKVDILTPPQWTAIIAGPGATAEYGPQGVLQDTARARDTTRRSAPLAPDIVPPDPFTTPPMQVNPARNPDPKAPLPFWLVDTAVNITPAPATGP